MRTETFLSPICNYVLLVPVFQWIRVQGSERNRLSAYHSSCKEREHKETWQRPFGSYDKAVHATPEHFRAIPLLCSGLTTSLSQLAKSTQYTTAIGFDVRHTFSLAMFLMSALWVVPCRLCKVPDHIPGFRKSCQPRMLGAQPVSYGLIPCFPAYLRDG